MHNTWEMANVIFFYRHVEIYSDQLTKERVMCHIPHVKEGSL